MLHSFYRKKAAPKAKSARAKSAKPKVAKAKAKDKDKDGKVDKAEVLFSTAQIQESVNAGFAQASPERRWALVPFTTVPTLEPPAHTSGLSPILVCVCLAVTAASHLRPVEDLGPSARFAIAVSILFLGPTAKFPTAKLTPANLTCHPPPPVCHIES